MAHGPGKYDDVATAVRLLTAARGVVLIISGGVKGSGFTVQAPLDLQLDLPRMLREVAQAIEHDMAANG